MSIFKIVVMFGGLNVTNYWFNKYPGVVLVVDFLRTSPRLQMQLVKPQVSHSQNLLQLTQGPIDPKPSSAPASGWDSPLVSFNPGSLQRKPTRCCYTAMGVASLKKAVLRVAQVGSPNNHFLKSPIVLSKQDDKQNQ